MLKWSLSGILFCFALMGCSEVDSSSLPEEEPQVVQTEPVPMYAEHRKGVYYYSTGISENAKADGKAAAEVLGFRYRGENDDGEFVIAAADSSGITATCSNPCKVIHVSTGEAVAYAPESVIGAVFTDAINGFLEEAKR